MSRAPVIMILQLRADEMVACRHASLAGPQPTKRFARTSLLAACTFWQAAWWGNQHGPQDRSFRAFWFRAQSHRSKLCRRPSDDSLLQRACPPLIQLRVASVYAVACALLSISMHVVVHALLCMHDIVCDMLVCLVSTWHTRFGRKCRPKQCTIRDSSSTRFVACATFSALCWRPCVGAVVQ